MNILLYAEKNTNCVPLTHSLKMVRLYDLVRNSCVAVFVIMYAVRDASWVNSVLFTFRGTLFIERHYIIVILCLTARVSSVDLVYSTFVYSLKYLNTRFAIVLYYILNTQCHIK